MGRSSRNRATERRARVEQLRREQRQRERRRTLVGVLVMGALVVAVIIATVVGTRGGDPSAPAAGRQVIPSSPTGSTTTQSPPATVPNPTDIKGVVAYDTRGYPAPGEADAGTLTHDHVPGPVEYAVVPPVGGPHNGTWMNAGVYTEPVPSERAVHDLEHGAVWITYRPGLPKAQVQQLTDFVGKQSMIDEGRGQANRYLDLSPWADGALPSPIVISSWGYQLRVDDPADPRLQDFVDTFRHNPTYTPEFGSAVDGIPVGTGGRAASHGGAQANPPGRVLDSAM